MHLIAGGFLLSLIMQDLLKHGWAVRAAIETSKSTDSEDAASWCMFERLWELMI